MLPDGILKALDPRNMYRNRIDILKRIGDPFSGGRGNPDTDKYIQLPHGQIIKKENVENKRIFVNGKRVEVTTDN